MRINKYKRVLFIVMLSILLIVIIGISYALLQKNMVGSNEKIVYQVGDLEVKLDETGSKDINLENAIPTEDSDGLKSEPYSFLLVNNAVTDLKYTIYLEDDTDAKNKCGTDCELIPYNFIKYNLSSDTESLKTDNLLSSSTEVYTGTIESKATNKLNLRIWLSIDADNSTMGKYYFGKLKVILSQGDDYCIRNGFTTLSDCMLVMNSHESSVELAKQNITAKGTPDFSKTATTDEGLFMAEDDDGASYYYRGAVKNNYVSFAGFIWRIIRRNGDGSVRMIYAGKKTNDTLDSTGIGTSQFNSKYLDHTYMGYKYSDTFSLHEDNKTTGYDWFTNTTKYNFGTGYTFDETTRKFTLTGDIQQLTWKDNHDEIVAKKLYSCLNQNCNIIYRLISYYSDTRMIVQPISYSSNSFLDTLSNNSDSIIKSNLDNWYKFNLLDYEADIADSYFCNDRSINMGSGYLVSQNTHYGAYSRLFENNSPSLKCLQNSDKFNLENKTAKLDYPIALITADEASYAGAVADRINKDFYLYSGVEYYTMSPSYFDAYWTMAHTFSIDSNGNLEIRKSVSNSFSVRPVINLKADVKISSGDGTSIAPYRIN